MRRVVLLGGGYVTLHAYGALVRRLRGGLRRGEIEIVVISADTVHNFHGFTSEVVAGLLPIALTQTPLTEAMPLARVLHATVTHVDLVGRRVEFTGGELGYDALVVGTGGREPARWAVGALGHAARAGATSPSCSSGCAWWTGPWWSSAAGSRGSSCRRARGPDAPRRAGPVGGPRGTRPAAAAGGPASAERLGVDVRTGLRVLASDDESVTLSDGSVVGTHVVLATTGQRAVALPGLDRLPRDEQGPPE